MATLVLSTAGAAIGGQIGGAVLGVSAAAIGQAAGAIGGALIDQALFGAKPVRRSGPRLDRLHVQTAGAGAPLARVWGRMRVGGAVLWASNFKETVTTQEVGGGKGGGGGAEVDEYSYSISFAVALADGPIDRVGRIWADGQPFTLSDVAYRVHLGDEDQLADPLIASIEGAKAAPAYRGVAYIIFEDLDLGPFGNRIPQFSVEVYRAPTPLAGSPTPLPEIVKGVALSPGSGEFSLATTPVRRIAREGVYASENVHATDDQSDLVTALDQLQAELPNVETVALIIAWFGTDLRCGLCEVKPGVEGRDRATEPLTWSVSSVSRADAHLISTDSDARPYYGGTPADAAVIEAIQELTARGLRVLVYPFLLMDVPPDNTLADPWSDAASQPPFPWRGRITLADAPGRPGSTDKTAAAGAEVDAFFGTASASDFTVLPGIVTYNGPAEFRYRRFILHCAALAAAAGGVDAFAIGSEMRSLTQIRDGGSTYPSVHALQQLAAEVRTLVGATTKLTYAADWSEYFGHQPTDGSGDVHFHLDPLWADANIDAVSIDAYFPLSDWRDDTTAADEGAATVYDLDYLSSNIEGGEYYDWFYASDADRYSRTRTAITDGAHSEPWIFRAKDIRAWWSNQHYNRPGGVRDASPTSWTPQSKPIWLTEVGCPAVDRGANQPNVFYDPKSSESALPHFSRGHRDDEMQRRYLQAALSYWAGGANPVSAHYAGPMIDLSRSNVWTWDARPWPDFPARTSVWSDGSAHHLGHWITGRLGAASLPDLVAEPCAEAGLTSIDVSALAGMVDGVRADRVMPTRDLLEALMIAFDFRAVESGGVLRFIPRDAAAAATISEADLVVDDEGDDAINPLERTRLELSSLPRAARLTYIAGDGSYEAATVEATRSKLNSSDPMSDAVATGDLPIVLSTPAAQTLAERMLADAWAARDGASFALPPSRLAIEPTDVLEIETAAGARPHRVARISEFGSRIVEASRIEPNAEAPTAGLVAATPLPSSALIAPPIALALDLPLLTGDERPHAPWLAAFVDPWPGPLRIYRSAADEGYARDGDIVAPASIGATLTELVAAAPHLWTRGQFVDITLSRDSLASRDTLSVLNGANALALLTPTGDWEVLQFQTAELVASNTYRLSTLLRGQAGTEPFIAASTPIGSRVVVLDGALAQSSLPVADRGLLRHYRIGSARKAISSQTHAHLIHTSNAAGLRPYAPTQLRAAFTASGDLLVTWIRRTRIGGDSWEGLEAPLGEEEERYQLRVLVGDGAVLTTETSAPTATLLAAEIPAPPFDIAVAQISAQIGAGPETRRTVAA